MKTGEVVLLYNLANTEKGRQIKKLLIPLGISIKEIAKEQYLQPIGSLVGVKGFEKNNNVYTEQGFEEEMLVLHKFTSPRIDLLLKGFKKAGIEKVDLKAVVTPTNAVWNSLELYEEIKKEHESMQKISE